MLITSIATLKASPDVLPRHNGRHHNVLADSKSDPKKLPFRRSSFYLSVADAPFTPHFSHSDDFMFQAPVFLNGFNRFLVSPVIEFSNGHRLNAIAANSLNPRIKDDRVKTTLEEENCLPFIFENNDPNNVRTLISLPVASQEKKASATALAGQVVPLLTGKKIRFVHFKELIDRFSPDCDPETVALTALSCMKSETNLNGLVAMPMEMFNDGPNALLMARAVIRNKFEQKGIKTARDIETFTNWLDFLQEPGLNSARKGLSLVEILQLAYPGMFSNFDPAVRMWLLKISRNGDEPGNRELKIHACAWVFAKGAKVFDTESMTFNPLLVREVSWHDEFEKYGVCFTYGRDKHIHSKEDTFLLAAEGFGLKKVFGFDIVNGEIPPWFVTSSGMWEKVSADGRMLIDDVSEYLITKYIPSKYPQYCDKDGKFLLSNFDRICWTDEYNELAPACHQNSGVKLFDSLERVRPKWFGHGAGQIRPELLKQDGKWSEENKRKTFRRTFIVKLMENGLKCIVSPDGKSISFTVKDFIEWHKSFFPAKSKNWTTFFKNDHDLTLALRYGTTDENDEHNSIGRGISILFGSKESICLKGHDPLKNIIDGLKLTDENKVFQIPLTDDALIVEAKPTVEKEAEVKAETKPRAEIDRPILNYPADYVQRRVSQVQETIKTSPIAGLRMVRWLRSIKVHFDSDVFRYSVAVFKHSCIEAGVSEEIALNYKTNIDDFEKLRKYLVLNEKSMRDVLEKMKQLSAGRKSTYQSVSPLAVEKTPEADW